MKNNTEQLSSNQQLELNIVIERLGHEKVAYKNVPDPLEMFESLKGSGNGFLLESADRCGEIGRFSIIGIDPILELTSLDSQIKVQCQNQVKVFEGNPFDVMKALLNKRIEPLGDLPFSSGGLAGYIGYDAVRHIEFISDKVGKAEMQDIHLMLPRYLLVMDRNEACIDVITFGVGESSSVIKSNSTHKTQTNVFVKTLKSLLGSSHSKVTEGNTVVVESVEPLKPLELAKSWTSKTSKNSFVEKVHRAKEYVKSGDAFQIVFSRRLTKETELTSYDLYKSLRHINPSPYMFIVDTAEVKVVGASPETMVHLKDKKATIHPIAGTRPRGGTEEEDNQNEKTLIEDIKENAEHLMLVDLARNDIGRISKYGTVEVPKFKTVERFSHVMHIVSEVTGEVDSKMEALDVFKACFPAGTVSGAPKIRAMSIIDDNEPERRGVYAGAVGWIGTNGDMDTCIAIRTAVLKNGKVSIQAGGGLVQDSDPEMEFMETIHKSASIMRAVQLAETKKLEAKKSETTKLEVKDDISNR